MKYKYKIVADSCCEFPEEWENDIRFERVALGLDVDGDVIMDDETFDQMSFLSKVAASPNAPKSFCPSPVQYRDAFDSDADVIFCFTLSSYLSGSFNAAVAGRSMYLSELREKGLPKKRIFICDSKSASVGETQLAVLAKKLLDEGRDYGEICLKLTFFANKMKTFFVLDNLDTFRKNGRLTGVKAIAATALNVKPVMAGMGGEVVQAGQGIGFKKAYEVMIDLVKKEVSNFSKRTIMISHCNAYERALDVKREIEEKLKDKIANTEIIIIDMKGVSSMYANDGGIIVTV